MYSDFVISTYVTLGVQLDQKAFALEGYLAYLGPGEGVDARYVLEDCDAHVGDCQVEGNPLHVLGGMHFHAIKLTSPGRL